MNRNEEFTEFMKELDGGVPEVGESIKKGSRRKARKQFLYQPLMGLTAMFVLFVLSVNLCAPVAKAFSNVPLLKDLTKAVTFSKSLRAALENDYTQDVYQIQSRDGVTVEITAMIVDKQELTVFYRILSEQYDTLAGEWTVPRTLIRNDITVADNSYVTNYYVPENIRDLNEEIRYITIDFFDADMMPEKMPLCMKVWNAEAYLEEVRAGAVSESNDMIGWGEPAERYSVANFEFELDLDLAKIQEPVLYEVNQSIELDGQNYTITNIEVYPTYMNMNMVADEENTALLSYLLFYVEGENGEIFGDNRGKFERNGMYVAGAESPYFSEGKISRIVITGANWVEQGKVKTIVNLVTGEVSNLPENISMREIRSEGDTYDLVFEMQYLRRMNFETGEPYEMKYWMVPFSVYYDAEGKYCEGESRWTVEEDEEHYIVGESGIYEVRFENYPYEEVWLANHYSKVWYPEQEVSINLK